MPVPIFSAYLRTISHIGLSTSLSVSVLLPRHRTPFWMTPQRPQPPKWIWRCRNDDFHFTALFMPYTMHDQTKHAWQQVLWQWSILLILSCQRPSGTEFVHTSSRTEGGIPSDMWWILPASSGSVLLHLTIYSLISSISSLKTLLANLNISEAPLPTYQTTESSKRFCSRKQTMNILICISPSIHRTCG